LDADPLDGCHYASEKAMLVEATTPSGYSRFDLLAAVEWMPATLLDFFVCLRERHETHKKIQQGRPALVSTCRRSLAALAVSRQRILLSSRHVTGAVLGSVRSASSISSAVAVVAAVRIQLPVSHRLVAPLSQPRNQPGFTEPTLALVPHANCRHGSARAR